MKRLVYLILFAFVASLVFVACNDEEVPTYILTLAASPENSGLTTGSGEYEVGEIVTINATANENYTFYNWTIGDTELSKEASFNYTIIKENVAITANFKKQYTVKIGAQSNTTIGAFYSISTNKVYTQAQAFEIQNSIDFLCFYEPGKNELALSSPGARIKDIYTGENAPTEWTTQNFTKFQAPKSTITVAQFDQLNETDALIEESFDNTVSAGNKIARKSD